MCEDPYALAPKHDVGQSGSECVVSIRYFAEGLKSLNVGSNLIFSYIEADAGPVTELFHYVYECDHVFNGIGDRRTFVCVPIASQSEVT
jgi:hypothetical protein